MKMKNKLHYLMMALIVAVVSAVTWSCNKDDDPSLAALRDDKLQFLTDSLRISDSLRLTNNAGVVNYAITIVDGATSSIFANPTDLDGGGRVSKTQSAVSGAVVTISQYGKRQTDTTDASGIVVFNGFFRSAVNITVEKTDFTTVSYISGVNIQDSTRTGTISFVGNLIPIFPLTGPNTATIAGRATIQTDLTNKTRELVPDGTIVTASIDATNTSYFAEKFLTIDINDGLFKSACGCQFIYVGNILQASYQSGSRGTVTGGNYSITVPAAIDGLPLKLQYSDVAADQILFEADGVVIGGDDRTATYRTLFGPAISADAIPSGSSIDVTFVTNTGTGAQGTALVSGTTGTIDRINITDAGEGYSGTPVVQILGNGTGATATATVTNGSITNIAVTNPGTGYSGTPTVNILDGDGFALASVNTLAQNGTVVSVVIDDSGFGYTAAPTVTFSAPTGTLVAPVTATGTATISGGRVTGVTITNAGAGYIAPPTVTFSAAPAGGQTATASAYYSGESILDVQIVNPGSEYSFAPAVIFDAPTLSPGIRAQGTATINAQTGQVTGITITNAGMGYAGTPGVTLQAVTTGAIAEVFLSGGSVLAIDITNQGSDYASAPAVVITGDGAGATGTAVMVDGKVVGVDITNGGTGYSTVNVDFVSGEGAAGYATVTNGQVTAITVTDRGHSYTGAPRVVLDSDVGGGATATATIDANGGIDVVTVVTGGSGYLEGNTPSGTGVNFSAIKGTTMETKPGLQYINDVYYGTGLKQSN